MASPNKKPTVITLGPQYCTPGQVQASKEQFLHSLTAANAIVTEAQIGLTKFVDGFVEPAQAARAEHKARLDNIYANQAKIDDILLAPVLAFLPGCLGGAVGQLTSDVIKKLVGGAWLTDGLKDAAKAAGRGAQSVIVTSQQTKPGSAVSTYKEIKQVKTNALDQMVRIARAVTSWSEALAGDPKFEWWNFSALPHVIVKEALLVGGASFKELPTLDADDVQRAHQQWLLTDWIDRDYGRLVAGSNSMGIMAIKSAAITEGVKKYGREIDLPDLDKKLAAAWTKAGGAATRVSYP